jgi:hemoglobin/transferrin/lactoferrin receptor protein
MSSTLRYSIVAAVLASSSAFAESDQPLAASSTAQQAEASGVVKLYPITVKTKDGFDQIGAVTEKKIDVFGQDLNEVLRSTPGSFTQHDIGQGGIAINLRGMEGAGRVNTSIDGVSQNFYQSAPHGWNGNTTYVDENLISEIEIAKGAVAGEQGANALAGSANFRTISASDLLQKGRNFGAKAQYRWGTNGYGQNAMLASAFRQSLFEQGSISFLTAISGKNKYGYKNGAGEQIASDRFDPNVALEGGLQARSILTKLEFSPNPEQRWLFSYLGSRSQFSNNHTPLEVNSQTGILEYVFDPLTDLVNFKAKLTYNHVKQYYVHHHSTPSSYTDRSTQNPSLGLLLQNQSNWELPSSDFGLTYGLKLLDTRYEASRHSQDLLMSGEQNLQSYFLDANWQLQRLSVEGGVRHERYQLKGYLPPAQDNGGIVFPKGGDYHFKQQQSDTNPYLKLGYQLNDWLQLYTSYAYSSRGPNVNEVMYANSPNNPYSMNPFLKAEQAQNRDVGLNIIQPQLWFEQDELRLKLNYFNNRIKNYIHQEQFYVCGEQDLRRCNLDDYMQAGNLDIAPVGLYLNIPDTTRMSGYELEVNYDFGRGYLNLSYTQSKTDFPADYLADMGFAHLSVVPESYWKLDLGTRWLDNKLLLGTRLSYFGRDTVAMGVDSDLQQQITQRSQDTPKLIDVYAKYALNRDIQLFVNVENLGNRVFNYSSSGGTLGTGNLGSNSKDWANQGTGRGRTYYGGISIKF